MTDKKTSYLQLLQTVAMAVATVRAIGSLYFMFHAGRYQKSVLLIALFTGWVLSPFMGLLGAAKMSSSRVVSSRASLYWLMIILAIGSLLAYNGVLIPYGTKAAFIFLVATFTSWVLILIVILIGKRCN